MITGTKLMPLSRNAQPGPTRATRMPAIAGPTTRAELNRSELSAIAFARCCFPISSDT